MSRALFLLWILVCAATVAVSAQTTTEGSLYAENSKGAFVGSFVLKRTAVRADVSGFIARVTVEQEFENSFAEPVEAVYKFPLSQNGAVDAMTMIIGERTITGIIKRRAEARKIYETAKAAGVRASLLDQERPNIFTQAVANVMPGDNIRVRISYVETLRYDSGSYEFVFPMTVGPRYNPASAVDAAAVSPPVAATRSGGDISIEVNLDAGVPVQEIRSPTHEITQTNFSPSAAKVSLSSSTTIPNKDFILRYDAAGSRVEDAVLATRGDRGGFFTLILQPPDKIATDERTPKEIVFVLDSSGSMSGFPIEKAKEAIKISLDGLYPDDRFNLITFSGDTSILFEQPVPATRANIERARAFLESRAGDGGTEMLKAITAALAPSRDSRYLRVVCFMTDGFVGNENEIIAEIKKYPQARLFSFGIGSSVNRFLLDKMAEAGSGEVEYVGLNDDGAKAAQKFYERVRSPLLTDLQIDWGAAPVADASPARLGDLFSAKPIIVTGRYTRAFQGSIRLNGRQAGQPYTRDIAVNLPETESRNGVLATLWARRRIDELSGQKLKPENAAKAAAFDEQITNLGLEFSLMTELTSFVAVDEGVANPTGNSITVNVPAALPDGVDGTKVGTEGGGGGGASANTPITATVDVTAGDSALDGSSASMSTTVTSRSIVQLPASVGFSSLMKISPNTRQATPAGFGSASDVMGNPEMPFFVDGSAVEDELLELDGIEMAIYRAGLLMPDEPEPESEHNLNGRAITLPAPAFSTTAAQGKSRGRVAVEVKIDSQGKVTAARALSGGAALRSAVETAAASSTFAPTLAKGQPVRVSGLIVYSWTNPENIEVAVRRMKAEPLTAAEAADRLLAAKLHVWLYDLVERSRFSSASIAPNDALFVSSGRARIEITLKNADPAALSKLELAGFAPKAPAANKKIVGTAEPASLEKLAAIGDVIYILPKP